jgi:hypothetical protein
MKEKMMGLFKNASPEFINLGANDLSAKQPAIERDPTPQHMPLFYIWAEKGSTKKLPLGGGKLLPMYGSKTFDSNYKYFNHATRFLRDISGTGNVCMVKRLVPEDAGVRSNIVTYIDVLEDDVPNYVRDSVGNYVIDPNTNSYKVDSTNETIPGYKIKFITEKLDTDTNFGMLTTKQGTMEKRDSDGNVVAVSTMYPFVEVKAKHQGEFYNKIGFSISSLYGEDAEVDVNTSIKALTYKMALHEIVTDGGSPTTKRTLFGEPDVLFTFKDKAKHPVTKLIIDLKTIFNNQWFNETNPSMSLVYSDYEDMYLYSDNLKYVSKLIMEKEKTHISTTPQTWDDGHDAATIEWFDYTTDDQDTLVNEEHLLTNILAGKSSKNINYFTLIIDKTAGNLAAGQKEVSFSKETPILLEGGSDGTMDNETFERLVVTEIKKYADPNSEVIDNAINTETIFYDSGYTVPTKQELVNFISLRKDTILVISAHEATLGEKYRSLSEERAIGVAMRTVLNLAPESEYFGTGVVRALSILGTGKLRDGSSNDRIPLTYEVALKAAKMMGAGNFKWKPEYKFDNAPGNIIEKLVDIQPGFVPAGVKPNIWGSGIVWAQPYDRDNYHFPALQTVYDNDTSALNNFFTIIALSAVTKIADDAWRNFTGTSTMTNDMFITAVTAYLTKRLQGIFGGLVKVIPEVIITDEDEMRGYSWKIVNKVGANVSKTKLVYATEIYRMSELA